MSIGVAIFLIFFQINKHKITIENFWCSDMPHVHNFSTLPYIYIYMWMSILTPKICFRLNCHLVNTLLYCKIIYIANYKIYKILYILQKLYLFYYKEVKWFLCIFGIFEDIINRSINYRYYHTLSSKESMEYLALFALSALRMMKMQPLLTFYKNEKVWK